MPLVAISPNALGPDPGRVTYQRCRLEFVDAQMSALVQHAGGLALMAGAGDVTEPGALEDLARRVLDHCQGLILAGGVDVGGDPLRDLWELALFRAAFERERPILGICRGLQLINVALGGTLFGDLPSERPSDVTHRTHDRAPDVTHGLRWTDGLARWETHYGEAPARVNSVHHQGIDQLGQGLEVMAVAEDGLVEAVMHQRRPEVLGVQWHPEWMQGALEQSMMVRRWMELAR